MQRRPFLKNQLAAVIVLGVLAGGLVAAKGASSDGSEKAAQSSASEQSVVSGRALARELSAAFQHAAELVKPAVVPIYAERPAPMRRLGFGPFDQDLRRFFDDPRSPFGQDEQEPTVRGLGSGVVLSADGYIVTNNHVVADATEITVVIDDERYEAEAIGTDPETDLAVIKIDPEEGGGKLPVATLGSSEEVQVGQWVIAIGNPFELLQSVTAGIVSAKGRATGLSNYENLIQTDAAINRGNSGGALADLEGRVIGINTAISSPTGGNVGIGFAIPIDQVKKIVDDLIDDGEVARGFLNILPQDLDDKLAKALGLESKRGALVANVTEGGPADRAGIERGDVIVELDGQEIEDSRDLRNTVASVAPGETVPVKVIRDGETRTFRVQLGERPQPNAANRPAEQDGDEGESYEELGLELTDLTPRLRQRLELDEDLEGVLVARVAPGGPAADAGLVPRDVIVEVGGEPVDSVAALERELKEHESGDTVALLVQRGTVTVFVALELP